MPSKSLFVGLSVVALIATNGASFWLGKKSQVMTFENVSYAEDYPLPSSQELKAACAKMYVHDMESDRDTRVRVIDAKGIWNEISASISCSVISDHQILHNGYLSNEPNKRAFFSLRKEYVIRHISESEFKNRLDEQS